MLIIINTIGVLILIAVIVRVLVTGNWLYEQHWFRRFCVYSLNNNLFLKIGPEIWKANYIAFLLGGMLGARPVKSKDMPKGFKESELKTDLDLTKELTGKEIINKIDTAVYNSVKERAKKDTEYLKSKEKQE